MSVYWAKFRSSYEMQMSFMPTNDLFTSCLFVSMIAKSSFNCSRKGLDFL